MGGRSSIIWENFRKKEMLSAMRENRRYERGSQKTAREQSRGNSSAGTKSRGGMAGKSEGKIVYTAEYKVNRSDTLLEFLLRKCNTSRNNVKTLLANGQVLVNGTVTSQFDFTLAKDDEVKISKTPLKKELARAKANRSTAYQAPRIPRGLKIIYEDADFIAVDKPVGLLSVESDKERDCAYGLVMSYLQSMDKAARPFVLHRIDKETSGVLVFAKNPKVHSILRLHWNERVKTREYIAVAEGKFEEKQARLEGYLRENKNNLMYVTRDPSGQKAITEYKVIRECEGYSLLAVEIMTGRKNQIRVQLSDIGHPIVGDDKYGFTKDPLGRLGLHASKLVFEHPISGEEITISAPAPSVFWKLFG